MRSRRTRWYVRAAELKKIVRKAFGKGHEVPRFAFMEEFSEPIVEVTSTVDDTQSDDFALRLIYPYCAAFGDPLMDPELSSYPEGLLQRLAAKGVNGIWMHSVLINLCPPTESFPGRKMLLTDCRLKRLVDRAAKYGIGIYHYMNEPRAMPRTFFDDSLRQQLMGAPEGEQRALCTSVPGVLPWVERSVERVFREVPGLGGVFTITASEEFDKLCFAGADSKVCERCRNRSYADLIVEVNQAITAGVKRAAPDAKLLVVGLGMERCLCEEIISRLPKSCWLMSVSEWSLPIERGGVSTAVGEYALSAVGPGPRALSHWEMAKKAGLKTVAKVQVNASWEMAVVPSVPVLDWWPAMRKIWRPYRPTE